MIDRKYSRTADTGRFELIHRGTSVPVPIYVGIDLRVEGKEQQERVRKKRSGTLQENL